MHYKKIILFIIMCIASQKMTYSTQAIPSSSEQIDDIIEFVHTITPNTKPPAHVDLADMER